MTTCLCHLCHHLSARDVYLSFLSSPIYNAFSIMMEHSSNITVTKMHCPCQSNWEDWKCVACVHRKKCNACTEFISDVIVIYNSVCLFSADYFSFLKELQEHFNIVGSGGPWLLTLQDSSIQFQHFATRKRFHFMTYPTWISWDLTRWWALRIPKQYNLTFLLTVSFAYEGHMETSLLH